MDLRENEYFLTTERDFCSCHDGYQNKLCFNYVSKFSFLSGTKDIVLFNTRPANDVIVLHNIIYNTS